ncbi:MATE family efflux transporter [Arhodomonas sp. AD133]|uniref:MATE family efflux transporter n=1 Tax=Arhodomonas sp. AD133 TaxID=3415009 RepID=UPI003EBD6242
MSEVIVDATFVGRLLRLALPVCVQMVLFNLLGLVDVLMLGHIGALQVAAAGLGTRVMFITVIVLVSVATGATILGAQYVGASNDTGLRRAFALAITVGTAVMAPVALAFLLWPAALPSLASSDPELLRHAGDYLRIVGPTVLLSAIVIPFESALRAIHATSAPTWISAGAIGVNVFFNWLLIFGHWGLPALGIVGAAWATVIGRFVHLALCLWVIYRLYPRLALRRADYAVLGEHDSWRRFTALTWPLAINEALWVFGIYAYNVVYGRMGTTELAVVNMLAPLEGVLLALFVGVAIASSILVGNELGAERFDTADAIARWLLRAMPGAAIVIGAAMALSHDALAWFYPGVPAPVLEQGEWVLIVLGLILWSKVLNMALIMGILRAGGDNRFVLIAECSAMWGVGIPLAAAMGLWWQWPLPVVFLASFVEEAVKAAVGLRRYRSGAWRRNLVAGGEDAGHAVQVTGTAAS